MNAEDTCIQLESYSGSGDSRRPIKLAVYAAKRFLSVQAATQFLSDLGLPQESRREPDPETLRV